MPISDQGKRTAPVDWVFPIIGIALAVLLAWGIGYLQARETERRYYTPRQYQESAKTRAKRTCVGMEPVAMFECVDEHVESAYEQAHSEQDLSAQQRSATSALLSSVVSFLALVATGVGLFYVRETLLATLKAVEDTSDATNAMREANVIAQQGARPWLTFQDFEIEWVRLKVDPEQWAIFAPASVKVRNDGSTPAKNISISYQVFDNPWDIETRETINHWFDDSFS